MGTLLRILLVILIIYWLLKLLGRFLGPYMMRKMVRDAQKRFEEQFRNPYYRDEQDKTEPGKTYISRGKGNRGKVEDADFEEID
ncbi:MAG: hypothetical protein GXO27_02220 [Chlorobi bacterium]|nr:hypothetical protein [Chlorobiota bacterium]